MSEAIDRVLERVARELGGDCIHEIKLDDCNCAECKTTRSLLVVLERELKPLLEAGQAMRGLHDRDDGWFSKAQAQWDAALAPAQAGKERG